MHHINLEAAGLTKQQGDIIRSILFLKSNGIKIAPIEIYTAYQKVAGKAIQKPNLFAQLRTMADLGFLVKTLGEYHVNMQAVVKAAREKKKNLEAELERLKEETGKLEKFSKNPEFQSNLPVLQYLDQNSYFDAAAYQMAESEEIYTNSVFPWICFPYPMAEAAKSINYCVQMQKLCEKRSLNVKYISAFNCEYFAGLALKAANGNRKGALDLCSQALQNMRNMLKLYPTLSVRFMPRSFDMHFIVTKPKVGNPYNAYFYFYAGPGVIQSGVVINSPELACNLYNAFNREFDRAVDLRSARGKHILDSIGKELRKLIIKKLV
ncbi:MAG: hypothetical protein HY362_03485 [Candidatus Aenigmarchaeota archaeon]|nr:hypothetical protein [Candidatus Aenigmarchaeota archaeon]